ncbi:MAG: SDR family oxidoreductase [Pseudomonadota bacterium]|nr:SDR family oxidoreductase [Pseudomonadota bacterium]
MQDQRKRSSRVVLITGCSSGIGRTLAQQFHARGYTVIATARRPDSIEDLAQQGMRTQALDVCSADSIAALKQQLQRENLAIDLLINNAGYGQMGPLLDLDSEVLRAQFETNVVGVMAVTRALVPLMRTSVQPRIVNIGSVSGILITPFAGAYCASKAAVHALSDALRMELKPLGIAVITIQPGAIQSGFGHSAKDSLQKREAADSPYAAASAGIEARAGASQQHATSTEDFAKRLIKAVTARRPPATIRIGSGSTALPLLARLLPKVLCDRILSKRFGLDRLT